MAEKTDYDSERRPVQVDPLRWNPPKPPWEPPDDPEFWRGRFSLDTDHSGFRTRSGKRQIGFWEGFWRWIPGRNPLALREPRIGRQSLPAFVEPLFE